VGAVVAPGETLVEIVPLGDELIVEAEIDPAEVAFVRVGQDARVRLTAYDFTRYGALPGVVAWVSADTFVDEEGGSFYRVRVRTAADLTGPNGEVLPVLPGMVAEVDILTGRHTVLEYLLQPILRAQGLALSER
jgi:adhesin transport system membrane fusion protein